MSTRDGRAPAGLSDASTYAVALDGFGAPWVGTGRGVARFDGKYWLALTPVHGLADDQVQAMALGSEGTRWFGRGLGGVREYAGTDPKSILLLPLATKEVSCSPVVLKEDRYPGEEFAGR